jgi:hypothetical protein
MQALLFDDLLDDDENDYFLPDRPTAVPTEL